MRHLCHHAANGRCIGPFDNLIQPRETESSNNSLVGDRSANHRPHILQAQMSCLWRGRTCLSLCFGFCVRGCFRRHNYSSSAVLPRTPATNSLFFSFFRASKVALITLCGLVVPIDLVSTF